MDRRSFVALGGAVAAAAAHEWAIEPGEADASQAAGRFVGSGVIDGLDDMTANLRRLDDEIGGGSLAGIVRAQAVYVAGLIRNGRFSDSAGRRLHAVLSELLRLSGWVSFDGGNQDQAERFWIAALHAAHTVGDRALGANVLGFMAEQAWSQGRLSDAARIADTAVSGYGGGSPRVSAILHMRAARAHAMVGQHAESRACIDSAWDFLSKPAPDSGDPGWSYWMDETSLTEQAGKCFMFMNDYPAACRHLESAVQAGNSWQGSYVRDGTSVIIALATAHARNGEPERACTTATRAVSALSGHVDSPRLTAKIRVLRADLQPYRALPAVREFGELAGQLQA